MDDLRQHLEAIAERGITRLPGALPHDTLQALRDELDRLNAAAERERGPATERFIDNLPAHAPAFLAAIEAQPAVRAISETLLGPNCVLASLNARTTWPGQRAQGLHRDHQGQLLYERRPDGRFHPAIIYLQTLWMLDDFTPENGATVIVESTHTPEAGEPREPSPFGAPAPLLGEAGTVAVFAASLWHGGGEHRKGGPRRAFHGFFSRPWAMPQYDNPRSCSRALLASLTPYQRRLLGYDRQAPLEVAPGRFERWEAEGIPSAGLWEQ
jgi:ectoine hydroxylase-related dioxygenase (phytanoyl-CoA dioxygenase family)